MEQEWQELEGHLRMVMWLQKFIRSIDSLKKVHPKEYNLTFEICLPELFSELRD